jgi:hypothetical protein
MTVGPGVGDAVTGQPAAQVAQPVARGGYQGPNLGADQPPTFEVGGEQVTLDELQRGYMRQGDYTQKTQALAAQRQQYEAATRLAEALQADPHGTLLQLATATGVDLASLQGPAAQSELGGDQGTGQNQALDPSDPVQAELMALREQVQQLQQGYEGVEDAQANAWLDQETVAASEIFEGLGIDFDPEELYAYAAERELTDVSSAAKALAFDKLSEAVAAQSAQPGPLPPEFAQYGPDAGAQNALPQVPGTQQRTQLGALERLAAAAQTPRGGMTSASRPQPQPTPGSVNEAFAQTLQELGISDLSQVDMNT